MNLTSIKWSRTVLHMLGASALAISASAFAACWGDSEVVAEYLFIEGEGSTTVNTGIDEDDGNAALVNGAGFHADAAPSNGGCGWSLQLPGTGSGSTTPAAETEDFYDPFAEAGRFTIMAWVRRESGSAGSNTSARIASDTSSLTLTNTTAGVEFRFAGSGGGLYLRVNGSEVGTTAASVPPNGNEWRHVAVVYDGTRPATNTLTRNVHFYVDGIQHGDGNTLQGAVVGTNDNRLTLGNSSVGRGIANLLVGKMDDVIILYDVAPAAVGNGKTSETIRCYMELNDDIERPVFIAPSSVMVDAGPCLGAITNLDLAEPVATDNCGVTMLYSEIPAVLPIGTNSVVWHAYDAAGNHASCTQQVVVVPSQTLDCDGDGLTDGAEVDVYHTDPLVADTDGDGHLDGREIELGTDPLNDGDYYGIVINAALPITNSMANAGEWVELFNSGPGQKPLAGFRLQTALPTGWTDVFTFPEGTMLDSGDFLVVGSNGDFQAALELPDSLTTPPTMSGIRLVAPSPSAIVADALLYGFTNEYGISRDGFGEEYPIVKPRITNVIRRTWIGYDTDHAGDWKNVPSTSWIPHTQGDYLDLDGDGLSNTLEIASGVYPNQGGSRIDVQDSDLDGRNDAMEWVAGTDASRTDTDGDAFPWDSSSLPHGSDAEEASSGTDANNADTDGDGVPDGWEIAGGLNPLTADTNGDGISDGMEDSDGDGIPNAVEVGNFTNPFDAADVTPRPYLWERGFPGEEIDEGDIGYGIAKVYRVKVRTNSQPIMVQVQEYGYMAEDFIVECTAPSIYLNPYDYPYRNRLYCLVPGNVVEFTFTVRDGQTTWANENPLEYGADILLRHEPAGIDLDAGVPEASEESVGFFLADKSAHPGALRRLIQIVGPSGGWGYASNIQLTYDTEHLRIYDSADGSNALPNGIQFPVSGGLPVLYAEGIAQCDMQEAWVEILGGIVPVHDRVTATVLKADIGPAVPLADRTLHPNAPREPLVLKQTLPAEWAGSMRLSFSNALAFEGPDGGDPIDLAQTTFPNAQLPRTVYLEGDGCGLGRASFAAVDLSDCVTNIPLHIFGVNATLDGVAENDEENPGGFIADRTAHTNAPRTALTLAACGPAASPGTLDLTWDQSRLQIYSTEAGGTPLPQYTVSFANFTSTPLYVEGIAPGSNVLQWTYSEQTNCVDRILVTAIKVEIEEVGFTGDHLIKEWPSGTAIDSPDGTSPTWKRTDNPDKPVAYTKGTQPTAFSKVSVSPDNLGTTLTADFRIKVNGNVVATKDGVQLDDAAVSFDSISFSSSLETTVKKTEPVFEWEMKLDGVGTWTSIGSSGPHTFYWTHGTPTTADLFDLALEKATGYINGDSSYAGKVNSGINGDLLYDPGQAPPSGYETGNGGILQTYSVGAAQCDANAFLLKYLLDSMGADGGNVVYYWGGVDSTEGTYYGYTPDGTNVYLASFRCDRPANPRFTFHAMTSISGTLYDPSYVMTGAPGFTEFAPPDEENPPLGNFPGVEDVDWDNDGILDPSGSAQSGSRNDWESSALGNAIVYPYIAP